MVTERILIVDDETSVCQSVKKILSRKGYTVSDAQNVEDAVTKISQTSYDLVITDLMMPKTNGLELLKLVRDNYPELDVIMITGYASIESAVNATKLGAAGYLPKPFTPDELMTLTEKTLVNRRSRPRPSAPVTNPDEKSADDLIDVDMPFSAGEVSKATSKQYVETLTHSDIPVGKARPAAAKAYCATGQRDCVRLVKEGRECPGECPIEKKERARAAKSAGHTRKSNIEIIDVDMPFPIEEVERYMPSAYLNCLDRSGIPRAALYGRDATARHSVLVVDDEPIVCHSIRKILSTQKCSVDEVFDTDAAMHKLKARKYDLIILDLKMPKRSGLEVLKEIQSQLPDTPVVMMSGYASVTNAIEAIKLGALNFISKPFTPAELTKVTAEVFSA